MKFLHGTTVATGPKAHMLKFVYSVFLPMVLGFLLLSGQKLEANQSEEYLLKAAFIYNFGKFVEWPQDVFSSPNSPVVLGILGDDPFGEALEPFRDKPLGTRKLYIKRLKRVEEADDVNMIFICQSEQDRLAQILRRLSGKPVLTVSDTRNFVRQGGMIGLIPTDSKVHFEINLRAARQSRLEISSKLLKLAESVVDEH